MQFAWEHTAERQPVYCSMSGRNLTQLGAMRRRVFKFKATAWGLALANRAFTSALHVCDCVCLLVRCWTRSPLESWVGGLHLPTP